MTLVIEAATADLWTGSLTKVIEPAAAVHVIDIAGREGPVRSAAALARKPGQKDRYEGPDRREGAELDAEACREQGRICFAQAVAADSPEERERLRLRGEHWLARAKDWRPRAVRPTE